MERLGFPLALFDNLNSVLSPYELLEEDHPDLLGLYWNERGFKSILMLRLSLLAEFYAATEENDEEWVQLLRRPQTPKIQQKFEHLMEQRSESYLQFAVIHGLPEELRRAPQTTEQIPLHLKFDSLIAVMWCCGVGQHLVQNFMTSNKHSHQLDVFVKLYNAIGSNWLAYFIENDQQRFLCDLLIGLKDSIPPQDDWRVSILENLEIDSVVPAYPISKIFQLFPYLQTLWRGDPWMWSRESNFCYQQKLDVLFPKPKQTPVPPLSPEECLDCFFRLQSDIAHPQLFFVDKAIRTFPDLVPLLFVLPETAGFVKVGATLASTVSCLLQRLPKTINKLSPPSFANTFTNAPPVVPESGPVDATLSSLFEQVDKLSPNIPNDQLKRTYRTLAIYFSRYICHLRHNYNSLLKTPLELGWETLKHGQITKEDCAIAAKWTSVFYHNHELWGVALGVSAPLRYFTVVLSGFGYRRRGFGQSFMKENFSDYKHSKQFEFHVKAGFLSKSQDPILLLDKVLGEGTYALTSKTRDTNETVYGIEVTPEIENYLIRQVAAELKRNIDLYGPSDYWSIKWGPHVQPREPKQKTSFKAKHAPKATLADPQTPLAGPLSRSHDTKALAHQPKLRPFKETSFAASSVKDSAKTNQKPAGPKTKVPPVPKSHDVKADASKMPQSKGSPNSQPVEAQPNEGSGRRQHSKAKVANRAGVPKQTQPLYHYLPKVKSATGNTNPTILSETSEQSLEAQANQCVPTSTKHEVSNPAEPNSDVSIPVASDGWTSSGWTGEAHSPAPSPENVLLDNEPQQPATTLQTNQGPPFAWVLPSQCLPVQDETVIIPDLTGLYEVVIRRKQVPLNRLNQKQSS